MDSTPVFKNVRVDPAQAKEVERQRREREAEALRQGWGLLARHERTNWDALRRDGEWYKKYEVMEARAGKGGLFAFVGGRGNGKTQMAAQLMKHAVVNRRSARYTTAMELFMRIKDTWHERSQASEMQVVAEYVKPSLLVVDEYGKRPEKEWQEHMLFHIVDQRYGMERDTILIDNRSPAEFKAAVGPSVADRLNEGGGVLEFTWGSFR